MGEEIGRNLVTLVSANSLNGLKSGNFVLDFLLSMILVMMIPILLEKVKYIKVPWFSDYNEKYKIRLTGSTNYTKHGFCSRNYSDAFCAVSKYMEEKCDLTNVKEFFLHRYKKKTGYIPGHAEKVQVTPDIMCNIIYTLKDDDGWIVDYDLVSNKSLKTIHDFVFENVRDYKNRMDEKLYTHQRYFCPENYEERIRWKTYIFTSSKRMENIFFPEKQDVLNRIDYFLKSRKIYEKKGIPWTLGILLSGCPGTGKTSFVKALINYTKRHVVEVPLGRIKTYGGLKEVMLGEEIDGYTIPFDKRLYLIEDIDCLDDIVLSRKKQLKQKQKKKSKEKENDSSELDLSKLFDTSKHSSSFGNDDPLTLSHILNIIDGPLEAPGRILVMTSNHPEKLDEALIRDGRMDIKLKMKPLNGKCLKEMVQSFFLDEDLSEITFTNSNELTPAKIQNLCFSKPYKEVVDALL